MPERFFNSNSPTLAPESLDSAILAWMHDLAPHGVFVTDTEFRVLGWNQWLESNSGWSTRQVVGNDLFQLFPELQNRRLDLPFHQALNGQVSVLSSAFHDYLLPFPSPLRGLGYPHMLQTARIAPLRQKGTIVGTITTIEDVTQREHQTAVLRREHERDELLAWALRNLLQAREPEKLVQQLFPKLSAHIGADTYLNYFVEEGSELLRLHSSTGLNPAQEIEFARITQRNAPDELGINLPASSSTPRQEHSKEPPAKLARALGLRAYMCHPLVISDRMIGTISFASRNRNDFDHSEIEFVRTVAQFIAITLDRARKESALKQAQAELSQHAEELEKRIQERTGKLQETIAELESFSYSLAHDLRAPLRHVQGYAQALLEDFGQELSGGAHEYVDSIIESMHRLDHFTRDILDYSKLSRAPMQMRPIDLGALLNQIVSSSPELKAPGLVTIQSPIHPVLAESTLLQQCLANLLDNALKFVPKSRTPRIVVRTELCRNGDSPEVRETSNTQWVRIAIQDNGIGIPSEFHGKIFGIFERLWNQQEYDGTGIGLAIVAKAVQRMGGRFGVESEVGKGSEFWMQLPAANP